MHTTHSDPAKCSHLSEQRKKAEKQRSQNAHNFWDSVAITDSCFCLAVPANSARTHTFSCHRSSHPAALCTGQQLKTPQLVSFSLCSSFIVSTCMSLACKCVAWGYQHSDATHVSSHDVCTAQWGLHYVGCDHTENCESFDTNKDTCLYQWLATVDSLINNVLMSCFNNVNNVKKSCMFLARDGIVVSLF